MADHNFQVSIGDQIFLEEGGEEVGAVRMIERDHLVVYVENAGDFVVSGPAVKSVHDGKVVLDPQNLDPAFLAAARGAHEHETD
jgi:hypothetical protein